jgi:hypothetical protein
MFLSNLYCIASMSETDQKKEINTKSLRGMNMGKFREVEETNEQAEK